MRRNVMCEQMIAPGQKPELGFVLSAVRDGRVFEQRFTDWLARPTIVSVHMKNNTGSCDRQLASLAEVAADVESAGYNLLAISRDTSGSHLRYAAARQIPFTLVSDPDDLFAKAMGSLVEKSMYGRSFVGPLRAIFVFGHDGSVLAAERVMTKDHAAQVRELIKRA
jgi:thioredoxin-dependent peroxiredoxin